MTPKPGDIFRLEKRYMHKPSYDIYDHSDFTSNSQILYEGDVLTFLRQSSYEDEQLSQIITVYVFLVTPRNKKFSLLKESFQYYQNTDNYLTKSEWILVKLS